jgi:hypothetical protein
LCQQSLGTASAAAIATVDHELVPGSYDYLFYTAHSPHLSACFFFIQYNTGSMPLSSCVEWSSLGLAWSVRNLVFRCISSFFFLVHFPFEKIDGPTNLIFILTPSALI